MLTQTKRFHAQITKQLRISELKKLWYSLEYWYYGRDHNWGRSKEFLKLYKNEFVVFPVSHPSCEQRHPISRTHRHDKNIG